MTKEELRTELDRLCISQVRFSELVGVTARAVQMWCSGERKVPQPVAAFLKLYIVRHNFAPQDKPMERWMIEANHERLIKQHARLKADIKRYEEDCKSSNFEIANGSKLFLKRAQEDLETCELALDGLHYRAEREGFERS